MKYFLTFICYVLLPLYASITLIANCFYHTGKIIFKLGSWIEVLIETLILKARSEDISFGYPKDKSYDKATRTFEYSYKDDTLKEIK